MSDSEAPKREPTHTEWLCSRLIKNECSRLLPNIGQQELHMIRNIALVEIMRMNDARKTVP